MTPSRVVVAVQRDLLGDYAGCVLGVEHDGRVTPQEEIESLDAAMEKGRELMGDIGARAVTIRDGGHNGSKD